LITKIILVIFVILYHGQALIANRFGLRLGRDFKRVIVGAAAWEFGGSRGQKGFLFHGFEALA
jgi:hypothetical protein